MREQKYANILKEYEIKEKEELFSEDEIQDEKLSMTRELKFKELHDAIEGSTGTRSKRADRVCKLKIEEDELNKSIEDEISDETCVEDIDEEEIETLQLAKKLNNNREEKIEQFEDKKNVESKTISKNISEDDDIYLTTSFKPPKLSFRVKKGVKTLLVILVMISLLGVFSYYVAYPIYNKYINSKPKMIFNGSIDAVSKYLIKFIEKDYENSDIFYGDGNFKINSNIEGLDLLNNNTYGYRVGMDSRNKSYQSDIYVKEGNDEYSISSIHRDDNYYYKYSTSDNYLNLSELNNDKLFSFYLKYLESLEDISKDDLIYFVEKKSEIIKDLLEKDLFTSSKDEMEVNGKNIEVVRNSFKISKNDYKRVKKKYVEKNIEDEKLLKIEASLLKMAVSELKEYLQAEFNEEKEIVINIYTVKGIQVVGFDVEENGFRNLYYYSNVGDFDFHLNITKDKNCLEGKECVKNSQKVIDLVGKKKDAYTEVLVKYNTLDVATLEVKEFNEDKVELDYDIKYNKLKLNGDLLIFVDYENANANIDLSCKQDADYINLNIRVDLKPKSEIAIVDKNKLIKYTDKADLEEKNVFSKKLYELEILDGYNAWYLSMTDPRDFVKKYDIPIEISKKAS